MKPPTPNELMTRIQRVIDAEPSLQNALDDLKLMPNQVKVGSKDFAKMIALVLHWDYRVRQLQAEIVAARAPAFERRTYGMGLAKAKSFA